MAGSRIWDVYTGQEFLTPGALETLDLIETLVPLREGDLLLDVAHGRGSGAFRLAERRAVSVLGVDTHEFAVLVARAAAARGLAGRAQFVMGDGGRLPVRDASFQAAVCIGGPSIIGTERCLSAMTRALCPGGWLAVSDWVWRSTPVQPEAIPAGYDIEPVTLDEYAALAAGLGCEIVHAAVLPQAVWDAYYAPVRTRVAELRARHPNEARQPIEDELRVYDSGLAADWWRYAVVVGRKL